MPHEHVVADRELVCRNLLDRFADPPVRDAGRPADERFQFAPRAPGGGFLERVPAGQHEADDDARQVLAEGK